MVTLIINCRLNISISFHEIIHGFRGGRGIGTASLDTKLLHQLVAMREEVM